MVPLTDLLQALESGGVEVVDLTAPLSSSTPILQLPEPFGNTIPFGLEEISHYDERGPRLWPIACRRSLALFEALSCSSEL
jgi:hypothetical protein